MLDKYTQATIDFTNDLTLEELHLIREEFDRYWENEKYFCWIRMLKGLKKYGRKHGKLLFLTYTEQQWKDAKKEENADIHNYKVLRAIQKAKKER